MRRNWLAALLFALALAVHALAPAVANVAVAKGYQAAGESIELCLRAANSGADQQQTPGQAHSHKDACTLCQTYCDGVAPLAARLIVLGQAPVQWTTADWTATDGDAPSPRHDFSRQARAPPFRS